MALLAVCRLSFPSPTLSFKPCWSACSALSFQAARAQASSGGGPFKLALLGDLQGVGRPLSLLLARSPLLSHIHLFDADAKEAEIDSIVSALSQKGGDREVVAAGFREIANLGTCLTSMDMVVILLGSCGGDLFDKNAGMVKCLVEGVAQRCPEAWLLLMCSPLDSMLPMSANVLRRFRVFDPARLFGITKVDMLVAANLVGKMKNLNPQDIEVPVVGGHHASTILPFLSKAKPLCLFSQDEIEELTAKIRASTQDMEMLAKAAAMVLESCLRARAGENDIFGFALVQNVITPVNYFSTRIKLCPSGVQYVVGKDFIDMSKYEEAAYHALLPVLKANIDRGLAFTSEDHVVSI